MAHRKVKHHGPRPGKPGAGSTGAAPGLDELVQAIRRVNPTDRGLAAEETRQRYEEKSRLQSLLIHEHAPDLEVRAEADPGIALLRVRDSGLSAGHVRLAALDEAARSWVQRQLDLGRAEALPASGRVARASATGARAGAGQRTSLRLPDPPTSSPDSTSRASSPPAAPGAPALLGLGQAALAEYDYEGAESLLTQANVVGNGLPQYARPLLELLVDQLAEYDKALAIFEQLPSASRKQPELRLVCGVAAALAGRVGLAGELVEGHQGAQAGRIHRLLAQQALVDPDCAAADHQLSLARAADPQAHELGFVESELDAARARQGLAAENALQADFARGLDLTAAERRAREVLATWPDSSGARTVLRKVAEQRRAEGAALLVSQAEAEHAAGDPGSALAHLREAETFVPAGGEGERYRSLLREVEQVVAAQRLQQETAALEADLRAGLDEAVLRAWLSASEPVRQELRRRVELPELDWLAILRPGTAGACSIRAGIQGVLALRQALAATAGDCPERAVALLGPHAATLQGLPAASRALERARALRAEQRRRQAVEGLRAIAEGLASGGAEGLRRCEAQLAAIDRASLTLADREWAQRLEEQVRQQRVDEELRVEQERLLEAGDLFGARRVVVQRSELAAPEQAAQRQREWAELSRRIRQEWRLGRLDLREDPHPWTWLTELVCSVYTERAQQWLDAAGTTAVIPIAHGCWLFLLRLQVGSGQALEVVVLRTPQPMALPIISLEGEQVVVDSENGSLLLVDLKGPDLEILPLEGILRRGERLEDL